MPKQQKARLTESLALSEAVLAAYDSLPPDRQAAFMNYVRFVRWWSREDRKMVRLLIDLNKAKDSDAMIRVMESIIAHRPKSWPALVSKAKAFRESPLHVSAAEADALIDDILALAA